MAKISRNPGDAMLAHLQEVSMRAVTVGGGSSEAGKIGKSIGSTLNNWYARLHDDLEKYYGDTARTQDMMDTARAVVNEMKGIKEALEEYPPSRNGQLYFPTAAYNRILQNLADLGVPESQWVRGTKTNGGNYHISAEDLQKDYDLMLQYLRPSASQFSNEIASLQQDSSRDTLKVMYDMTSIKQNQRTLSGIWSTLKQMAQSIEGNI